MAKAERLFVTGRFGQMHLRIANRGAVNAPALLLLHMLPQSSRMFEPLIAHLGAERMIIAPDFPGYGESAGPEAPITATDYAQCIWECLDALDLPRSTFPLDLFGIHGGAKIAVEVVLQRPAAINRIALSSLAHVTGRELRDIARAFEPVPLDMEGTRFKALWSMILKNSYPDISLEEAAQSLAEMLRPGEHYAWGNLSLLEYNDNMAERLALLNRHIDLINPRDSLFERTRKVRELLPSCTYHERQGWGLMFPWSHTSELAQLLGTIFTHDGAPLCSSGGRQAVPG